MTLRRDFWETGWGLAVGIGAALVGVAFILLRSVHAPVAEVDFRFFWLAGTLWAEGIDPYGAQFRTAGAALLPPGNEVLYRFYPPQWWVVCRALAFTSIAHIVASGAPSASVNAIAPVPHPRSSRSPSRGGAGASRSNSEVPVSRWPWLNTPRSVAIVSGCGTFLRTQNDSATSSTKRNDQKSAPTPEGGRNFSLPIRRNFSLGIGTENMDEAGSLSDA